MDASPGLIKACKRHWMYVKTFGPGYLTARRSMGAGVIRIRTRLGDIFFRPRESDLATFWQTLGAREYDLDRFPQAAICDAVYREALMSGKTPVVIDAGANVGGASMWFSSRYPEARVIAVEPAPENAALCRKNNEGRNVEVIEAAIGAEPGAVSLVPADQAWGIQTVRGGSVPVVTVEDLLARVPNGVLLIVKVDIEGFESDLFASRTEWIDQAQAIIIEPHDWMLPGQGSSRTFRQALGPDFDMMISGENLIFIRPQRRHDISESARSPADLTPPDISS